MANDSQTRAVNARGKMGPRFTDFGLSDEQVEQMSLFNSANTDRSKTSEPARHPLEEDIERWDGLA